MDRPTPPVEHLVLDLGGVLFPSAMPPVVDALAAASGREPAELWEVFRTHLFRPFWSGAIGVDEMWDAFTARAGVPGAAAEWRERLLEGERDPLPAARRVPGWAARVRVGVLSNQRHEWALPALARAGLLGLLDPVLISSATGRVKPDRDAFAPLAGLAADPGRVLYVDDRPAALAAAAALGIATLRADPGGAWADAVDAALDGGRVRG